MSWMIPAAIGGGLGLASSFLGGGNEKRETKVDDFTRGLRGTLLSPQVIQPGYGQAYNVWQLRDQTYGPTPDFRVHQGPTPEVSGFYQGLMGRAGGAPYEAAAGDYATQAIRGGFLGSNPAMPWLGGYAYGGNTNPWLDRMVTQAQRQTGRNVASMFGRSGMGGSSLERGVAARELGNVAERMYGQAYENDMARRLRAATTLGSLYGRERGLQQEAAFNVPQLTTSDLSRIQAGLGAAQGLEGYGTRQRQEDLQAHQFNQQAPYNRLGFISSAMAGMPTGQTTKVSGADMNPITGALGGALAGYGMYRSGMFGGGGLPPPPTYRTGAMSPYVGPGGPVAQSLNWSIPGYPA